MSFTATKTATKTLTPESKEPNKTLKIAYLLHRFPHLSETFVMREIYALRQAGVDVTVYSLMPPKHKLVHEQAQELLDVTHYSPLVSGEVLAANWHYLRRKPLSYWRALKGVVKQTWLEPRVLALMLALFPKSVYFARELGRESADHIHAHFVWIGAVAASVVNELNGTPYSVQPHAFGLFSRPQDDVRAELRRADKLITISNYNIRHIHALCPEIALGDIALIPCGIETEDWKPLESKPKNPVPHIVSVGRFEEKKGFEYLLEACAELKRRGVAFRCSIGGNEAPELYEQIKVLELEDVVDMLGILPQPAVLELYQNADIFALACVEASNGNIDGIPVVLMEALACELSVVTSRLSGIPDLVVNGESGLLITQRDATELTDALERLIHSPELRQRLGAAGREVVLARYDIDKNAALLIQTVKELQAGKLQTKKLQPKEPRTTEPV